MEHLRHRGSRPEVVSSLSDLRITVATDSSGNPSTRVVLHPSGKRVRSIVNRGHVRIDAMDDESRFVESESLAALWAVLHLFAGRVVNRPLADGLFSYTDLCRFPRPRSWSTSTWPPHDWQEEGDRAHALTCSDEVVNMHALYDGRLVARRAVNEPWSDPSHGPARCTVFDPCKVRRILVVPERIIELRRDKAIRDPLSYLPSRIMGALQVPGLFMMFAIEDGEQPRLLKAYPFPDLVDLGEEAECVCKAVAHWVDG